MEKQTYFLLFLSMLVARNPSICLQFNSTPQDPMVLVSGVNTTNVTLIWTFQLASNEFTSTLILRRLRSANEPDSQSTLLYYCSVNPGKDNFDSVFYTVSKKFVNGPSSGSFNFTILNVSKQINNKDGTPYDPLSTDYLYKLTAATTLNLEPSIAKSSIRSFFYDKPSQFQVAKMQDGYLHVNEGQPINITCTAKGNPRVDYIWKFKDKQLHSIINNTIVINNATLDDGGMYTCTAVNFIGIGTINVTLIVVYIRNPNCAANPSLVVSGNKITMNCSTYGYPPVNYTWTVGNTIPGPIRTVTATPSLDGVIVTCKATNKYGTTRCQRTLQVQYKPAQLQITNMQAGSLYVNEGQPITITCTATGNPRPDYVWKFKDKQLHSAINNTIIISNATLADGGMYTCTAVNSLGSGTINVTIIVNYLRDANCGPKTNTVIAGHIVTLRCTAIGYPSARYNWTSENEVSQGPTKVLRVTRSLNGSTITCSASNSIVTKTCSKRLIVHYLQGCAEKSYSITNQQCVPMHPDGYPVPTMECSPRGNVLVTQNGDHFRLCGVKSNTSSTCMIKNTAGRCTVTIEVLRQISIKVFNGNFKCTSCVYQSDLANNKSPVYQNLKSKMEKMLRLVYAFHKYVTSLNVTGYWPGSVIVEFQLILAADVPDPLLPFKVAACKHAGSLDGLIIDVSSIQTGSYILPASESTTQSTTTITACQGLRNTACDSTTSIALGVLFGVSLICNFLLLAYIIFWHRKLGKKPNRKARRSMKDKVEAVYMNSISLQDNPPTDGQNMVRQEPADYKRQPESPNTSIYQPVNLHPDTYSSLSPSTKLPPKPAVMTTGGVYQDLQATSHQYQSLDHFSQT